MCCKSPQNSSAYNNKYFSFSFCGSRIQEWLARPSSSQCLLKLEPSASSSLRGCWQTHLGPSLHKPLHRADSWLGRWHLLEEQFKRENPQYGRHSLLITHLRSDFPLSTYSIRQHVSQHDQPSWGEGSDMGVKIQRLPTTRTEAN